MSRKNLAASWLTRSISRPSSTPEYSTVSAPGSSETTRSRGMRWTPRRSKSLSGESNPYRWAQLTVTKSGRPPFWEWVRIAMSRKRPRGRFTGSRSRKPGPHDEVIERLLVRPRRKGIGPGQGRQLLEKRPRHRHHVPHGTLRRPDLHERIRERRRDSHLDFPGLGEVDPGVE